MKPQRHVLPGGRWHFQHGPIDIVIGADGDAAALAAAHEAAWRRFDTVLSELVAELPELRRPIDDACRLRGAIARRMWHACRAVAASCGAAFITPMAAVAGAVADELIGCYARDGVARAWVNNGGDIALHLAPGASVRVGLCADLARVDMRRRDIGLDGRFGVSFEQNVRGIATSGWRGRSFSLGIADSVTVLAATSSEADAAATLVANAVDVADPRIVRRPACELKDDSDLGTILVTVDVPRLAEGQVRRALDAGLCRARELQAAGRIEAAFLVCQNQFASTAAGPVGRRSQPGRAASRVGELGSVFA